MADPKFGWAGFRPYDRSLWRYLALAYPNTPYLLSSATINTESLQRITESLDIEDQEICVLSMSCDRTNIFQQIRKLKQTLSPM